jgi:hypothetical protein
MNEIPISIEKQEDQKKIRRLYPERVFNRATDIADKLTSLTNGQEHILHIPETERGDILHMEDALGEKLEQAFAINPFGVTFSPDYFLTDAGKDDYEKTIGEPFPEELNDTDSIEAFLFSVRNKFSDVEAKRLDALAKRSIKADEDLLIRNVISTLDDDGNISFDNLPLPRKSSVLLTPEKLVSKIGMYLELKKEVKHLRSAVPEYSQDSRWVREQLLQLYQKRINTALEEFKLECFSFAKSAKNEGPESLNKEEAALVAMAGTRGSEKNLSRYDKFFQGAEKDESGRYKQIGGSLLSLADEIESDHMINRIAGTDGLREHGLNEDFLRKTQLSGEELTAFAEETLATYGLLSDESNDTYSPEQSGPASDGKWRFVLRPHYRSFAIDGRRKTVVGPMKDYTVLGGLGTAIAHEIEGHVLQRTNREAIPLRILKKVGAGRSDVLVECGAMNNEALISKEITGTGSQGHPHYIRAMAKKLEGGDYFDCVRSFYESAMKSEKILLGIGKISREEFRKRAEGHIKTAVNRTKRLFRGSSDYSSNQPYLAKSKDTAYAEQVRLYTEFKKRGLEKFIYVGGIDIDFLPFMVKSGFLDPSSIKQPLFHSLKIWDRIKDRYQTNQETDSP